MGLEAFKSSSSSKSSSNSSSSTQSTSHGVTHITEEELKNEGPALTVVEDRRRETSVAYTGMAAFPKSSRHKTEKVIEIIYSQEEYKRLNEKCEQVHGRGLDTLFETDVKKAQDFVNRFSANSEDKKVETCPVCNKDVHLEEQEYVKLEGEIIHSEHKARDVYKELEEE